MIIKEHQVQFNNNFVILVLFGLLNISCDNGKSDNTGNIDIDSKDVISIKKSRLKLVPNLGLVFYNDIPFTGISEAYYDNNRISESITYVNGKKHGYSRKWFETGVLSFEAKYLSGKLNGVSTTWWNNGFLRSESVFQNGIANGIQRQWYKSGSKFKELNIVNGKEEGMQKAWRENGKIFNNYQAKNGRVFGLKRANLCYELEEEIVQYNNL